MTTKVVNVIKQGVVSLFVIVGLLSCEGNLDDVGVNITDNNVFDDGQYTSNVITYNEYVTKRQGNKLGKYLLGVYKNDDFGQLDASIISQLVFNTTIDFGENPTIDTIIVNIPYYATRDGDYASGTPKYVLDSVIGDLDTPFNLKVSRLTTYLNTLDPADPSKELVYNTDDTFTKDDATPFYEREFFPNARDTVLCVERPEIIEEPENGIYNIDTIKRVDGLPTLKIPLNKDYFTANFINNPAIFESTAAFIEAFNGLYIEASAVPGGNPEATITTLNLSAATMTIYYTNDEFSKRTKQSATFNFGSVIINKYERDYAGSNAKQIIDSSNPTSGDAQLAIQGAAGSIALVDVFTDATELTELRERNLLINDANLIFYIDQTADKSIVPDRIFLYNYDDTTQLPDLLFEGLKTFGGTLERDSNGDPYRYKVNVTDYVSKILAKEDPIDSKTLAVKVLNNSDIPSDFSDVDVEDLSWNPKGIILHGNNATDVTKKVKLEITYTEIN